jgi:hypothetical protein
MPADPATAARHAAAGAGRVSKRNAWPHRWKHGGRPIIDGKRWAAEFAALHTGFTAHSPLAGHGMPLAFETIERRGE